MMAATDRADHRAGGLLGALAAQSAQGLEELGRDMEMEGVEIGQGDTLDVSLIAANLCLRGFARVSASVERRAHRARADL